MFCALWSANHYAWFERSNGLLIVKWGHYPKVDGRIDPRIVTTFVAVDSKARRLFPLLAFSERASAVGGLEVLLGKLVEGDYTVGLAYDRGVYAVTEDGKWVYGGRASVEAMGFRVREVRRLLGFAKTHFSVGGGAPRNLQVLGFDLEIVLKDYDPLEKKAKVVTVFRGAPVDVDIEFHSVNGRSVVRSGSSVQLSKGLNLFVAKFVERVNAVDYDVLHLVSTLTLEI